MTADTANAFRSVHRHGQAAPVVRRALRSAATEVLASEPVPLSLGQITGRAHRVRGTPLVHGTRQPSRLVLKIALPSGRVRGRGRP